MAFHAQQLANGRRLRRRHRKRGGGKEIKPKALPIESVNHIARVTRDLEASTAFYRDVLGSTTSVSCT